MKSAKLRNLLCCLAAPLAALGGFFCSAAVYAACLLAGVEMSALTLYLINALQQLLCLALPAALLLSARPGRWKRVMAGALPLPMRTFSLTALLAVSATVPVVLLTVLFSALTGVPPQSEMLPDPRTPWEWTLTVLAIAVVPALCEELLFRATLQSALCRRLPRAGVWIVALAFAAMHREWAALPGLMLLGLALGWVYRRHGFAANTLLHMLYNAVVLLLSAKGGAVTLGAAALCVPCFILTLRALLKKEETGDEADRPGL